MEIVTESSWVNVLGLTWGGDGGRRAHIGAAERRMQTTLEEICSKKILQENFHTVNSHGVDVCSCKVVFEVTGGFFVLKSDEVWPMCLLKEDSLNSFISTPAESSCTHAQFETCDHDSKITWFLKSLLPYYTQTKSEMTVIQNNNYNTVWKKQLVLFCHQTQVEECWMFQMDGDDTWLKSPSSSFNMCPAREKRNYK